MESQMHINLVKIAVDYIRKNKPEIKSDFIITDSSGTNSSVRIGGNFIPDIYYSYQDILIIGEAKTTLDFHRQHSLDQYDAYIKECQLHQGEAILVIAIPWELMPTAKNMFRRRKEKEKLEMRIIIINDIGRSFIL